MLNLREGYDQELESLRLDILKMGDLAVQAMEKSLIALERLDLEIAKEVIEEDNQINQMETDIEQHCVLVIAKQQPIAKDLRIVMTGLKVTTDLERIGDYACNIAETVLRILPAESHVKPLVDIPKMAILAGKMVKASLESYHRLDLEMAQQVFQADDEVDALYKQVFEGLVALMEEHPETVKNGTLLIHVARCLERIADHSTNIAEWVVYLETGQRVRAN